MDYSKTGRLIAKKRKDRDYTLEDLSKLLGVSPQAISLWENGKRYPDPSSQVMLFKVLGLNPVELIAGLEMFEDELKAGISNYMNRIDEKVYFTSGMVTDEDGNEFYLDLNDYKVVTVDKDGNLSERWIPFSDYYNPAPVPKLAIEKKPVTEYDPGKIYLNHADCVLTIPVEILDQAGRPLYFVVLWNHERNHLAVQFMDELTENGFDIPPRIYTEDWKGVHVVGDEFGRMLCNEMGIRRRLDLMEVNPVYNEKNRMLILDLEKAIPSNVELKYSGYLFPQIQYEEMRDEIDE